MILARVSILLLHCLLLTASAASSSSTTKAPSKYESIRALDNNGESIQLQHASQAASQHGSFIMAVKHANQTIHIVSVASQPSYQRQRPLELLHRITPDTLLLCSGVQADARWLVDTLRQMHKQMQLRYGSSGTGWAQRLASLYRAVFWGIPEEGNKNNNKWQQTRWVDLKRWGRPLGVQSILIEGNQLFALEPSGVIIAPDSEEEEEEKDQRVAIGKHSRDILRQWQSSNAQESLADQLKRACDGILLRGTVLSIVQVGMDISWQMQL